MSQRARWNDFIAQGLGHTPRKWETQVKIPSLLQAVRELNLDEWVNHWDKTHKGEGHQHHHLLLCPFDMDLNVTLSIRSDLEGKVNGQCPVCESFWGLDGKLGAKLLALSGLMLSL